MALAIIGNPERLTEGNRAAPTDLWQIASHPNEWIRQVQGTESLYYRAIGSRTHWNRGRLPQGGATT